VAGWFFDFFFFLFYSEPRRMAGRANAEAAMAIHFPHTSFSHPSHHPTCYFSEILDKISSSFLIKGAP